MPEEEIIAWFISRFGSLSAHSVARVVRQNDEYAVVEQLLAVGKTIGLWIVRYKSRLGLARRHQDAARPS